MMRRSVNVLLLLSVVAVLTPRISAAQVYQLPTPAPRVTAAGAAWQIARVPVFHGGDYYYPAGATVFFDGNVMTRTGTFRGVPIFEDATVEPHSIVYLPIGRNLMRPYERRREGSLAGTIGSRTPSFPIQRDIEVSASLESNADDTSFADQPDTMWDVSHAAPANAEVGVTRRDTRSPSRDLNAAAAAPAGIQSIPGPASNDGLWIVFEGARWYLDGRAVKYDAGRFSPLGNYRGFPVYRDNSKGDRIFVTVIADGPVAPFVRR